LWLSSLSDTVEAIRKLILPVLQRHGVVRAVLFGSVARGEARRESDIDLLIEFGGEKSLLNLVAVKMELEEVLGRSVDITTFNALHPALQEIVEQEQVTIL